MRRSWISILAVLALLVTSTSALADNTATINQGTTNPSINLSTNNKAAIFQKNDLNKGTINQGSPSGNSDNKAEIRQDKRTGGGNVAPGAGNGDGNNRATINQKDSSLRNEALIDQSDSGNKTPEGNRARINQNGGQDNEAKIQQKTDNNRARINQGQGGFDATGDSKAFIQQNNKAGGDWAKIKQRGYGVGDYNDASIIQGNNPNGNPGNSSSGHNAAKIKQDGRYNEAFINQTGRYNNTETHPALIDQVGEGHKASIVQTKTAYGNRNTKILQGDFWGYESARIDQSGHKNKGTVIDQRNGLGDNNAQIIQDGSHNKNTRIIQGGINDNALINQSGNWNTDTIIDQGASFDDNQAHINQSGHHNTRTKIEQNFAYNSKARIDQSGSWNEDTAIVQDGDNDSAYIDQAGYGNHNTSIVQEFSNSYPNGGNKASIHQTDYADNNWNTTIDQSGEGNQAGIHQDGSGNQNTGIIQVGKNNKARIIQDANGTLLASIGQYGKGNNAVLVQRGDGGTTPHSADIQQGQVLNPSNKNTAFVFQDANHNTGHISTVLQTGPGNANNNALVYQTQGNVTDVSHVTQNGNKNFATTVQGDSGPSNPGFGGNYLWIENPGTPGDPLPPIHMAPSFTLF